VARTGGVLRALQKLPGKVQEATVPPRDLGGICQAPRAGQQVAVRDESDDNLWHRAEVVKATQESNRKDFSCVLRYADNGDEDAFTLPDPDVKVVAKGGSAASDKPADTRDWTCGVLYRTNAQSRALEAALSKHDVSYVLQGSRAFFARKEIMDVMSYLRLLVNPNDQAAFARAVNYPPRGCGAATVNAFLEWDKGTKATIVDKLQVLLRLADEGEIDKKTAKGKAKKDASAPGAASEAIDCPLNNRQRKALLTFALIWKSLAERVETSSPDQLIAEACSSAGIFEQIKLDADTPTESEDRFENLRELQRFASEISSDPAMEIDFSDSDLVEDDGADARESDTASEEADAVAVGPDALRLFIQKADLSTDTTESSSEDGIPPVRLMTLHASKGLEFNAVWLTGAEEGYIPMKLEDSDLAEERRLLYVGATRAKECLTITCRATLTRPDRPGQPEAAKVSQFLQVLRKDTKLPDDVIQWEDVTGDDWEAHETKATGSSKGGKSKPYPYWKMKQKKSSAKR